MSAWSGTCGPSPAQGTSPVSGPSTSASACATASTRPATVPRSAVTSASRRSTVTTRSPRARSRAVTAAPRPDAAPVTTCVLTSSLRRRRRDEATARVGDGQRRGREEELVHAVGGAVGRELVEVPLLPLRHPDVAQLDHVRREEERVLAGARIRLEDVRVVG